MIGIAERLVNHVSALTEMQEIYDLHGYLAEMREAMEKWEAYVLTHHFQLPPDYRELILALTFRS